MYSEKELRIADTYSKKLNKYRKQINNEVKRFITQWGRNRLDYSDLILKVNINYCSSCELYIEVAFPEFGAGFILRYHEKKGIDYSKGSIGSFSVHSNPRQRDICILFAKLLEKDDKLLEFFSQKAPIYITNEQNLEEERDRINKNYPGLFEEYFQSNMFKMRKVQE